MSRTGKKPKIAVVGSLNADLLAYVKALPQPGQTISSKRFATLPGGKGANQAVAAARLGAKVDMYGCVGDDSYGDMLLKSLEEAGVNSKSVLRTEGGTGVALILVEESSENEIVVVPGANALFTPEVLKRMNFEELQETDILLLQHEIPMDTILESARQAKEAGVRSIILNPAPARDIPEALLRNINIFIPNETELLELQSKGLTLARLFELGIESVLETRGKEGVLVHTKDGTSQLVPAVPVQAVDTVGAGDTFVAAFAVAFGHNLELLKAVEFANHAAALSTTREGAQSSFPTLEELFEKGVILT